MSVIAKVSARIDVINDVLAERDKQDAKWGEQNHPNGTAERYEVLADFYRDACQEAFAAGRGTWRHIFLEEVFEAVAEKDPTKLRAELIQCAAVAVAWAEAIDRAEAAK